MINVRLKVLDQKTFQKAIPGFPLLIAITEVSTSGNEVPRATTDSVNTDELIHSIVEISKTLSIRNLAENANTAILTTMIEIYLNKLCAFFSNPCSISLTLSSTVSLCSPDWILYKMKITMKARRNNDSCQVITLSHARNKNMDIEIKKKGRSTSISFVFTISFFATIDQIPKTNKILAIFDPTAPSTTYSGNHPPSTA